MVYKSHFPCPQKTIKGSGPEANASRTSRMSARQDYLPIPPLSPNLTLGGRPAGPNWAEWETLEKQRDALRIQVAAVAAQQAALNEEEKTLKQRQAALDRQEEQLAAHLEARS